MAKQQLDIRVDELSLYQMKEILKLILEKVNVDVEEEELKDIIKKHFKDK